MPVTGVYHDIDIYHSDDKLQEMYCDSAMERAEKRKGTWVHFDAAERSGTS